MKYLFPDTNIFLHFQWCEDIPWQNLLNTSDQVTIVVTWTLLEEINKFKDHSEGRKRKRARAVNKRFLRILVDEEQTKVPFISLNHMPVTEEEKSKFDTNVKDDCFLLDVIHAPFPKADCYVVTYDTHMIIKSKSLGLNYYRMDDSFKLSEEPTKEELRIKELEKQLEQYTSHLSNPQILFKETLNSCIEFPLIKYPPLDDFVNTLVEKEAVRFPEDGYKNVQIDVSLNESEKRILASAKVFNPHPEEDIKFYQDMRKAYLEDFRWDIMSNEVNRRQTASFQKLKFAIFNDGNGPTGDLHAILVFPEEASYYLIDESKKNFSYRKPIEPKYIEQYATLKRLNVHLPIESAKYVAIDLWDVTKHSQKREFNISSTNIMHGFCQEWDPGIYINTQVNQEFEITWIIADSTHIEHMSGVLKVIVSDDNNHSLE